MDKQPVDSGNKSRQVFISFSSQDRDYADKISRHLQRCGIPVWMDSTNLIPGTPDWDEAIKDAIKDSGVILYLGSPHSIHSSYVKGEIAVANNNQVKILPVWIDGERWDECAPLNMIGMHYFDMRGKKFLDKMDDLVDLVRTYTGPVESEEIVTPPEKKIKKMNRIWLVLPLAVIVILGVVIYQTVIKRMITPPRTSTSKYVPVPDWMVKVEGGAFMMGDDDEDAYDDEKPVHQVILSTFYLSRYEVTQKQWREVMGTDPSYFKGDDLPVERISWYDAVEFCNCLSEQEGLTPCYNGSGDAITCDFTANGYRLPTEAEWEYACRAGTTTPFNTGENLTTDQANYNGNYPYKNFPKGKYLEKTTPVGKYPPNQWGLYDMHGNTWEWCFDWFEDEYYAACKKQGIVENPQGPEKGSERVMRGGSWFDFARLCRSACRNCSGPGCRDSGVGFRLVSSRSSR